MSADGEQGGVDVCIQADIDAAVSYYRGEKEYDRADRAAMSTTKRAGRLVLAFAAHRLAHADPVTDTPEVVRAKERISDAMRDSQYLAGVKAGWNAAHADDPQAAYAAIERAHAGYLSGFAEARAALAKHPTSPEATA